ncbi:MAG: hypothetical protein ACRDDY_18550 [Clostridium sp.]|uniref:hypothetical protein n=1 Tax=Clostridium sp. TaxID=1506 RepID=UPI003EE694ED
MKKAIYIGNDPTIRGMKCRILSKKGNMYTVSTGDDILGAVRFEVHKDKLKQY